MLARREEVVASMNALSAEVQPILEIVQDAVRRARRERGLGLALRRRRHSVRPRPPVTGGLALCSTLLSSALGR